MMSHALTITRRSTIALLVASILAALPVAARAAVHLYVPVTSSPSSRGNIETFPLNGLQLGSPFDFSFNNVGTAAFAVGPTGRLYASTLDGEVDVYAPRSNTFLYRLKLPNPCPTGGGIYQAVGLGVDDQNYLYVGYVVSGCSGVLGYVVPLGRKGVFVYRPNQQSGRPLQVIRTVQAGTDFAFDGAGSVYISEDFVSKPIQVYATPHNNPRYLRSLGDFQNRCIGPVALDRQGQLYAIINCLAPGQSFVAVFPKDANGTPQPLRRINTPGGLGCCGIALLGNALYVTNGKDTIYELDKNGRGMENPISQISTAPVYYGYFGLRFGP